ncbi:MAG: o-succinylbenzoate synthase [bacterium]
MKSKLASAPANHPEIKINWKKYTLQFKHPVGTSRGTLINRDIWFIILTDKKGTMGIGECAPLQGISIDNLAAIENKLEQIRRNPVPFLLEPEKHLSGFPALFFALETALLDLDQGGKRILFASDFTAGAASIPINGLIWMGDYDFLSKQVEQKLSDGWQCLKIKIGGLDFNRELELLRHIRTGFNAEQLELRVDANGAFTADEAMGKLDKLASFNLHSIEQPIKPEQTKALKALCRDSPVPVALDEELVGKRDKRSLEKFFDEVSPAYIVLKPSLLGGFKQCGQLIKLAEDRNIGFWITSSLESNIGLNALAQWTYTLDCPGFQGLGTGRLFKNNIPSPLTVYKGSIRMATDRPWNINSFNLVNF